MDIYDNDGNVIKATEIKERAYTEDEKAEGCPELTIGYILGQMEKIRADSGYMYDAIAAVGEIVTHPPSMNASDMGSHAKAEAIGESVKAREATNQKLLAMYDKMYGDIKPQRADGSDSNMDKLERIVQMMSGNPLFGEAVGDSLDQILRGMFT